MYFTIHEANAAARSRSQYSFESASILTESMRVNKSTDTYDVFLSHSISDSDLVLGIKTLLEERFNLRVYVDWVEDKQLNRDSVNVNTAETLRKRMQQSNSLFYLTTENSSKSKWMPWELGYFDGYKPNKVAILPVLKNSFDTFKGQEYLGLYPVIHKDGLKTSSGEKIIDINSFTAARY